MSKFTEWLKFYFVGFFTHNLSKEGGNRSFFNTLLGFILTFIIVCCGLIAGYSASFSVLYDNSADFKNFLYSAFANEDNAIELSVKDGLLSAEIKGGERINTLLGSDGQYEDGQYAVNGYQLVVDTREGATTYAEFSVECKKQDGAQIDYEAYRALTDEEKKSYTLNITYSGEALDPAENLDVYVEYLAAAASADLSGLDKSLADGEITEKQYADSVYVLYFMSYYAGLPADTYGVAPTLRTYYLSPETYDGIDKYIAVLDNVCFCAFVTDDGKAVEFSGYFNKLDDGVISGGGLSAEQMKNNVDSLIKNSFNAASGLNFLIYFISLSRNVALYVMAIILIALIIFIVLKAMKIEDCPRYTDAIKIAGSFQLWSALITFALTFALSFFLARGSVFLASEIVLLCVLALRAAVYIVIEILIDRKNRTEKPRERQDLQA